jgi:hypothetical protein
LAIGSTLEIFSQGIIILGAKAPILAVAVLKAAMVDSGKLTFI